MAFVATWWWEWNADAADRADIRGSGRWGVPRAFVAAAEERARIAKLMPLMGGMCGGREGRGGTVAAVASWRWRWNADAADGADIRGSGKTWRYRGVRGVVAVEMER